MKYSIQKWGRIEQKVNPLQYDLGGNMMQGVTGGAGGSDSSGSDFNGAGLATIGNALGSGLQSTGSSFGTIGGGALKGASTGAAIGSIIPGVGTVIGAGVGAVAGAVGGIFKNKQRKEEEKLQEEQEKQMFLAQKQQQLLSMPQSSGGIGYETRLNPTQMVHGGYLQIPISAKSGMYISSKKQYKYGGPVNYTQDSTKSLVSYMGGGTHQQNPLGGIPLGKTLGGKQNTVEQGETSFKFKEGKYVFSNRLKLR
jgi:hypothetical protein